jgi:hypothetical protein
VTLLTIKNSDLATDGLHILRSIAQAMRLERCREKKERPMPTERFQ